MNHLFSTEATEESFLENGNGNDEEDEDDESGEITSQAASQAEREASRRPGGYVGVLGVAEKYLKY